MEEAVVPPRLVARSWVVVCWVAASSVCRQAAIVELPTATIAIAIAATIIRLLFIERGLTLQRRAAWALTSIQLGGHCLSKDRQVGG